MSADDTQAALKEFKNAVNMSAKALAAWLKTEESKKVGFKFTKGGESVGHDSGKKLWCCLASC